MERTSAASSTSLSLQATSYALLEQRPPRVMSLTLPPLNRRTGLVALVAFILVVYGLSVPILPSGGRGLRGVKKAGRGGATYIYEMDTHDGEFEQLERSESERCGTFGRVPQWSCARLLEQEREQRFRAVKMRADHTRRGHWCYWRIGPQGRLHTVVRM